MNRTAGALLLVPLLGFAACQQDKTPTGAPGPSAPTVVADSGSFSPKVKMPAGFEPAVLGRPFADVRTELPRARLVKEGGDVYMLQKDSPPHFRWAQIWFHSGGSEAPPEDTLTVQRAIFATVLEEDRQGLAAEVASHDTAGTAGMRRENQDRFDLMKKAAEDAYGTATLCVPDRLNCEWNLTGYQVRLYSIDATNKLGEPVPIGVQYVIRAATAPDAPKPEPIKAAPSSKPAAPGVYVPPNEGTGGTGWGPPTVKPTPWDVHPEEVPPSTKPRPLPPFPTPPPAPAQPN